MPQPDNRRERGAKTQTSQQTVAPQGQMPGTISPISGGAAAAAPVLQIGQQAQIKKTGAELYQAIAGVAQGVQQGIKNYEQMYSLVSETEYADFETSYIKENERVKGDPTKMKTWMDTQTYKPNRVTAKRYHTMKAQVNQKSYEEEQSDELAYLTRHMSEMTNADALDYANSRIDQYDENSPVAKGLYDQISKLQGAVVAQTQTFLDAATKETYIAQNRQIVRQLQENGFPDSTSSDEFQMILAAASLGQATIDTSNGSVTVGDRSYMLNALPEDMPNILKDAIGNAPIPSLGVQAIAASKLPQSVLNPQGRAGGGLSQREIDAAAVGAHNGIRSGDTGAVRASISTVTSSDDPDKNYQRAKAVASTLVGAINADPSLSPAEKIRQLTSLSTSLGLDGEDDPWLQGLGIDDEAGVRSFEEMIGIQNAIDAQVVTGTDQVLTGFGAGVDVAINTSEFNVLARNAMIELSELAVHGGQESIVSALVPTSANGPFGVPTLELRQMDLAELKKAMDEGLNPVPVGISVIDPDIPQKVPFTMELTENGLVTTGSMQGATKPTPAQLAATEAAVKAQEDMRVLRLLPDPQARAEAGLSVTQMQQATDRLARRNPGELFAFAANNTLPPSAISESSAQSMADFALKAYGVGSDAFYADQTPEAQAAKANLSDMTYKYPAFREQLEARGKGTAIAARFAPYLQTPGSVHAVEALIVDQDKTLTRFAAAGSTLQTKLVAGGDIEVDPGSMEETILENATMAFENINETGVTFKEAMADPQNPAHPAAVNMLRGTIDDFSTVEGAVSMGALSEDALLKTRQVKTTHLNRQIEFDPNMGLGNTTTAMDVTSAVFTPFLAYVEEKGIDEPWKLIQGLDEQSYEQVLRRLNGEDVRNMTPATVEFLNKIEEQVTPEMYASNNTLVYNPSTTATSAEFVISLDMAKVTPDESTLGGLFKGGYNLFAEALDSPTVFPVLPDATFMGIDPMVWGEMMETIQRPDQALRFTRTYYPPNNNGVNTFGRSGNEIIHARGVRERKAQATRVWKGGVSQVR